MTDRELQIARAALEAAIEKVLAPTATAGVIKGYRHPLDVVESIRALDHSTIVEGVPLPDDLICPVCGSDSNERDELIKAEREIERLRARVEELERERQREKAELDALGDDMVDTLIDTDRMR